jgi:hypothetical protein
VDVSALLRGERPLVANGAADPGDAVPDDLSGLDDLLEPDPAPRRAADGPAQGAAAKLKRIGGAPAAKITPKQKKEITDALELIQLIVGGAVQIRDRHCGTAIVDNAENASAKALPIICRNPAWVAWFTGSAGWLDVLGLIIALKPVMSTWWGHHVTHTIGDGKGEDDDADDLSAFTAPAI